VYELVACGVEQHNDTGEFFCKSTNSMQAKIRPIQTLQAVPQHKNPLATLSIMLSMRNRCLFVPLFHV
jgi:hypothetical protein